MSDLCQLIQGFFQLPAVPAWIDVVNKLGVPSLALVGAVYTALQYLRAKRWRAGDLAVTLMAQLEADDELAFACRALDWGGGPLIVPERYRPLVEDLQEGKKNPTPMERGAVMWHDPELLGRAVGVEIAIDFYREPEGLIYRYCFDKLFDHLANIDRLLVTGQVKASDLQGLKYWLERIADYKHAPRISPARVFQPFLEHEPFGYRGVIHLGETLGVRNWTKSWKPRSS
jgi:hypothetical protein